MSSNDLHNAEVRVRELTAKIALRESQQALPTDSQPYSRSGGFIDSLRAELRNAAAIVVSMKYNPLEVIARMEATPPAAPPPPPPSADEVRAKLREILSHIPDNATVQSVRELFK